MNRHSNMIQRKRLLFLEFVVADSLSDRGESTEFTIAYVCHVNCPFLVKGSQTIYLIQLFDSKTSGTIYQKLLKGYFITSISHISSVVKLKVVYIGFLADVPYGHSGLLPGDSKHRGCHCCRNSDEGGSALQLLL